MNFSNNKKQQQTKSFKITYLFIDNFSVTFLKSFNVQIWSFAPLIRNKTSDNKKKNWKFVTFFFGMNKKCLEKHHDSILFLKFFPHHSFNFNHTHSLLTKKSKKFVKNWKSKVYQCLFRKPPTFNSFNLLAYESFVSNLTMKNWIQFEKAKPSRHLSSQNEEEILSFFCKRLQFTTAPIIVLSLSMLCVESFLIIYIFNSIQRHNNKTFLSW